MNPNRSKWIAYLRLNNLRPPKRGRTGYSVYEMAKRAAANRAESPEHYEQLIKWATEYLRV